jgi:4'-phosphopantetheinyl transferase
VTAVTRFRDAAVDQTRILFLRPTHFEQMFTAPEAPPTDEVHIQPVLLLGSGEETSTYSAVLSAEELQRASRFRFDHLKTRFILCRGALRILLGRYLGEAPASVQFQYGSKGKPRVESGLKFNVSHSGDLAVFAFAAELDVGIDIEQARSIPDMHQIASHFFSMEECADLQSVDMARRSQAFFNCWTRKEAYIKAIGDGLSIPLDSFRVSLHPDHEARLISIQNNPNPTKAWSMHHFAPAAGYIGAVAFKGSNRIVTHPCISANDLLR